MQADPRPEEQRMRPHQRLAEALFCALTFGLFGPPLGGLVAFLALAAQVRLLGHGQVTDWTSLQGLPIFLGFSYFPGLVPALLTGLVAGALRDRLTSWRAYALLATGASLATLLLAPLVLGERPDVNSASLILFGAPSWVAACLLARAYRHRRNTPASSPAPAIRNAFHHPQHP
jgi:hypothetical protein